MPKLEPKVIQKELEQGQLWPVYWLYGHERMKSRELLKRIRRAALGDAAEGTGAAASLLGLGEQTIDGSATTADSVLEAAQSPSLGGGLRFIVVQDAHALKEADALAPILGPKAKREQLESVCVFLSKDLDGRKKFSKLLLEKAAVVPCEEVPETDREAWIQYLAKRRGLTVPPELVAQMASLDPWSLDIIDQELEKLALAGSADAPDAREVLLGGIASHGGADGFIGLFFSRRLPEALAAVESFADQPDEALPLLGLLAWNVRQLALILADRAARTRTVKLNPYLIERFELWARVWSLSDVLELQAELEELDFGFKQTALLPLGLWTSLVTRFCS